VNYPTEKGWYLDFDTIAGERTITDAIIRNNEIIFTTMIPSVGEACAAGGESLLMALDLEQGTAPGKVLFDLNGDGKFNDLDKVLVNGELQIITGLHLDTGITAKPTILDNPDGTSNAYLSGTQGNAKITLRSGSSVVSGKRKSWVQIFL